MAEIQKSTALRAARANANGGSKLVRRGQELCLAINAHVLKDGGSVQATMLVHRAKSSGEARQIEDRFWAWFGMVGEIGPANVLALVARWLPRIEELEREFLFWLARMPEATRTDVILRAIRMREAALHVAHRRVGRRWDGTP